MWIFFLEIFGMNSLHDMYFILIISGKNESCSGRSIEFLPLRLCSLKNSDLNICAKRKWKLGISKWKCWHFFLCTWKSKMTNSSDFHVCILWDKVRIFEVPYLCSTNIDAKICLKWKLKILVMRRRIFVFSLFSKIVQFASQAVWLENQKYGCIWFLWKGVEFQVAVLGG